MMAVVIEIDPLLRERCLRGHVERTMSHQEIADALGVSKTKLSRLKIDWGWPVLPRNCPVRRPVAERPRRVGPGSRTTARLERLLLSQIAKLERSLADDTAEIDHEGVDRALNSYVRTLSGLRKIGETPPGREASGPRAGGPASPGAQAHDAGQESDEPDRPVRSLAELRDELGRQLERIRQEERARRGLDPDGPEPG